MQGLVRLAVTMRFYEGREKRQSDAGEINPPMPKA